MDSGSVTQESFDKFKAKVHINKHEAQLKLDDMGKPKYPPA